MNLEDRAMSYAVCAASRVTSAPPPSRAARAGTILIIVAGICALMASLSLAFLARMRGDAEESQLVMRDAQARLMLTAACNYIQEASRLGWDDPATPQHEEAFGWVDVRDGSVGPKVNLGDPARFPSNVSFRFPMWVWTRTRYATRLTAVFNPICTASGAADFGMPFLRNPDPQPLADNGWPASVNSGNFDDGTNGASRKDYLHGDPTPRANSQGMSWFRIRRIAPARFVVTCGAGGTLGCADWAEVQARSLSPVQPGDATLVNYFGNQTLFDDLKATEVRMWYEVEWNAAVGGATYQCVDNEQHPDHYQLRPFNPIHENYNNGNGGHQSEPHARNMVGTMRFVQRLTSAPPAGQW